MPSCRMFSASTAATVDFPEAGRPVIHIANASASGNTKLIHFLTILIHTAWIKAILVQYRDDEAEQLFTDIFRQFRIPDGMRHDKTAECEERCRDLQQFFITRLRQISLPESQEQGFQILIEPSGA